MNNAELFSWKPLFLLLVSFIDEKQLCVYRFFLKQIRQKFCGIFLVLVQNTKKTQATTIKIIIENITFKIYISDNSGTTNDDGTSLCLHCVIFTYKNQGFALKNSFVFFWRNNIKQKMDKKNTQMILVGVLKTMF